MFLFYPPAILAPGVFQDQIESLTAWAEARFLLTLPDQERQLCLRPRSGIGSLREWATALADPIVPRKRVGFPTCLGRVQQWHHRPRTGVVHSRREVLDNLPAIAAVVRLTGEDVVACRPPLNHGKGLVSDVLLPAFSQALRTLISPCYGFGIPACPSARSLPARA